MAFSLYVQMETKGNKTILLWWAAKWAQWAHTSVCGIFATTSGNSCYGLKAAAMMTVK